MLDQTCEYFEAKDDAHPGKQLLRMWKQRGWHDKFSNALGKPQRQAEWGPASPAARPLLLEDGVATQPFDAIDYGVRGDRDMLNVASANRVLGQAEGVLRSDQQYRLEREAQAARQEREAQAAREEREAQAARQERVVAAAMPLPEDDEEDI